MTATDELRRMLDERGVEYASSASGRSVYVSYNTTAFANYSEDTLDISMRNLTPEQAIEATLGRGTCHIKDGKCDQCGAIIRDKSVTFLTPTRQGIRMVEKYDASFCPNCGRKVVE